MPIYMALVHSVNYVSYPTQSHSVWANHSFAGCFEWIIVHLWVFLIPEFKHPGLFSSSQHHSCQLPVPLSQAMVETASLSCFVCPERKVQMCSGFCLIILPAPNNNLNLSPSFFLGPS